jgi:hypothetical protein
MRWSHTAVTASCAANGQTDRPKLKLVPFVGHCSARKKMPSNPDEWRRAGIAVGVILRQTRSKPPPPIRPAVTTASSFRRRSHDLQPERPAPRSSVGAAFSNWRFLHPKVWHNPTDGYRNLHLETPAAAKPHDLHSGRLFPLSPIGDFDTQRYGIAPRMATEISIWRRRPPPTPRSPDEPSALVVSN